MRLEQAPKPALLYQQLPAYEFYLPCPGLKTGPGVW
jgi:hypothetical protein